MMMLRAVRVSQKRLLLTQRHMLQQHVGYASSYDVFKKIQDPPSEEESKSLARKPSDKVLRLVDEVMSLTLVEAADLCDLCQEKLAQRGGGTTPPHPFSALKRLQRQSVFTLFARRSLAVLPDLLSLRCCALRVGFLKAFQRARGALSRAARILQSEGHVISAQTVSLSVRRVDCCYCCLCDCTFLLAYRFAPPGFGNGAGFSPPPAAAEALPLSAEGAAAENASKPSPAKGFDCSKKVVVVKEVRAITALGLREAKELVAVAARVFPAAAAVPSEEAAAMKAKLEAAGAQVALE
ncbi:ribosomal protein l7 [Cyclospora cayetanensis]|uniref:Ribosomal protein l7 n=1 Tax=Cyclospora cayetanensis TaxID=88456 RepID=A0A1D3D8X9_9EIME|nr:ribosomal protein l7 [Cyclospora cayetanensis]